MKIYYSCLNPGDLLVHKHICRLIISKTFNVRNTYNISYIDVDSSRRCIIQSFNDLPVSNSYISPFELIESY